MGDDNVLSDGCGGGGGGQSWEVDTGLQMKRENVRSTVLVWNNAQNIKS